MAIASCHVTGSDVRHPCPRRRTAAPSWWAPGRAMITSRTPAAMRRALSGCALPPCEGGSCQCLNGHQRRGYQPCSRVQCQGGPNLRNPSACSAKQHQEHCQALFLSMLLVLSQELPADAPAVARHVYFRDTIGNVSTSAMRMTKQGVRLVVPLHPEGAMPLDRRICLVLVWCKASSCMSAPVHAAFP